MKRWTLPQCYLGAEWPDYYVLLGQNRDSDTLTRSNFQVALELLGGESFLPDDETHAVVVVRESHWACGWVEWIGIHKDAADKLAIGEEIERKIESYPVLNEEHWSNLEYTEAMDYWASMSMSERVSWCQDSEVSIFAARREYDLPDRLYERLTA